MRLVRQLWSGGGTRHPYAWHGDTLPAPCRCPPDPGGGRQLPVGSGSTSQHRAGLSMQFHLLPIPCLCTCLQAATLYSSQSQRDKQMFSGGQV